MMRYGDKRAEHIKMICPAVRPRPQKQEEAQKKTATKQN